MASAGIPKMATAFADRRAASHHGKPLHRFLLLLPFAEHSTTRAGCRHTMLEIAELELEA
jgi:hypothetical protein